MVNFKKFLKTKLPNQLVKLIKFFIAIIRLTKYKFNNIVLFFILKIDKYLSFFLTVLLKKIKLDLKFSTSIEEYLNLSADGIGAFGNQTFLYSFTKPTFWPLVDNRDFKNLNTFSKKSLFSELNSVKLIGNSKIIILTNKLALHNSPSNKIEKRFDLIDPAILAHNNRAYLLKHFESKNPINCGIDFTSIDAGNFYHFIFEIICKFYFIKDSIYPNIPLLIDSVILETKQFKQVLDIFNEDKRELIPIDKGKKYSIDKLYVIPNAILLPNKYKLKASVFPSDILFNKDALFFVRKKLLINKPRKEFPKRIYLSRANIKTRNINNEDEVYKTLGKYGFIKIFPENYSIIEQAQMFSNAEFIAGPSGAAFTNILFCNKNCKILCFTNYKLDFSAFSTIASIFECEMIYFYSSLKRNYLDDFHDSFSVNIEQINDYFESDTAHFSHESVRFI